MIKKKRFYENLAPQATFLMKRNEPQARHIKQKCAAGWGF